MRRNIFGYNTSSRRYKFPTDLRIRHLWTERTGDESLAKLLNKEKVGWVCAIHFEKRYLNQNGKLIRFAVPTLHLPGFHQPATADNCFNYPPQGYGGYDHLKK